MRRAPLLLLPTLFLLILPPLGQAQNVQEAVKRGEEIFNRTCTGYCHGPKGQPGGAPRLAGRGFDQDFIFNTVTQGVPGTRMVSFTKTLTRAEVVAVVAYVATLNDITNPDLTFKAHFGEAPDFKPERSQLPLKAVPGHELFFDAVRGYGRCATCHEVNAMGIPVATAIDKVPEGVRALRAMATPQVQTATFEGETMPALVVSKGKERTVFYDLTSVPPVLRTADSSAVSISEGSAWNHASVLSSYNDAELASILEFLRLTVKP
jgi:mono/diheme cytochrome c family protein